jgi:hypothetical protein
MAGRVFLQESAAIISVQKESPTSSNNPDKGSSSLQAISHLTVSRVMAFKCPVSLFVDDNVDGQMCVVALSKPIGDRRKDQADFDPEPIRRPLSSSLRPSACSTLKMSSH